MKCRRIYALFGVKKFKILTIMRLFAICMLIFVMGASATGFSQQQKVTLDLKKSNIHTLFNEIWEQTGLQFIYGEKEVAPIGEINLKVTDEQVEKVLEKVLSGTSLKFLFRDDIIFIFPEKEKPHSPQDEKGFLLKGVVTDKNGLPLPGVTVMIRGTRSGLATDRQGKFALHVSAGNELVLVFSFIGMKSREVRVDDIRDREILLGNKELPVVLEEEEHQVEEVVVTGYANIRKSSFTGTSTQVSREELLKIGSNNILTALQVFDPSLRVVRNNQAGSDPNNLPEMYIRGLSGIGEFDLDKTNISSVSQFSLSTNPNLPVFILDGYEVPIAKIFDMDIYRVESINILKDAAATAMYGSRAANGVIVIESKAPQPGKLRVSYNLTGSVTAPDLTGYDFMNAGEKLETEVASGYLDEGNDYPIRLAHYREKLNLVNSGVDTYWLSQPLRTEYNHRHSLYVEGGADAFRFGLGLNYDRQNGVMKKSYRERTGAELKVDYRLKNFQITDQVSFGITNSQDSPYGSFYNYVQLNPYLPTHDLLTGELVKRFPDFTDHALRNNPLYDAILNSFSQANLRSYANNFSVNATFLENFQLRFQFAISYQDNNGERFRDPEAVQYETKPVEERGELFLSRSEQFGWNYNLLLMYNNRIKGNFMNFSFGLNAKEDKTKISSSHLRGFPSGQLHQPKYANEVVAVPDYSDKNTRLFGGFLTGNYTWNDIYLLDLSLRFEGSSEFGSDRRFAPFWSFGAGINLHNYDFMKRYSAISMARVRANYGETGKVDFPPYAARDTYELMTDGWHPTGMGGVLKGIGNNKLNWFKTNTLNIGADFALKNRYTLTFSWYHKRTADMVTPMTIPSSSGFTSYYENVGEIVNKGFELSLNMSFIRSQDWDLNVTLSGAHNTNKITKLSDVMKAYNDRVDKYYENYVEGVLYLNTDEDGNGNSKYMKPILKYEEGGSLTAIYGMKSLGISPLNGSELFMNRDGSVTFDWNSNQQVVIGNTEPDMQGALTLNLRYRNLTLYTSFLYEWGGDQYNNTLVQNVESVDIINRNVDRRVATMRWQKPGDIAPLKSIKDRYQVTRSTSRFVQKNDNLTFNSLSLGYDLPQHNIRKIGLSQLRMQFSMNDVFTLSSIKQERGLDYPFARTFNFTLNVSF